MRLFERSTRHVSLTPEGEVFAEEVHRIERDMRTALSNLQDLASRRVGRVAVAALPSVAAVWMPAVIAAYRAQHPQITVELFDSLAGGALAMLREGKADMAITAGGDLREFDTQVLRMERYYLVCRKDHPLAGSAPLKPAQLKGQELIHLARNSSVRQALDAQPGISGLRRSSLEVEHLATLAGLVAQGLGVSVVPELTLFHFRAAGLCARPLSGAALRRPIVLAQRKGKALSVAARAMRAAIEAHAK